MIIGGYHPLTLSDYPGTPAAVLFLQGCNWRCSYCHNRRLLPLQPPRPPLSFSSIFRQLQQRAGKIEGVVFSGGEPTLHTDLDRYMLPVKELGLKIKLDTNGTDPAAVRRLLNAGLLDYIAMDIKAPFASYEQITGCPVDTAILAESIALIAASGVDHQFRTTWDRSQLSEADIAEIKRSLPAGSPHLLQKMIARDR